MQKCYVFKIYTFVQYAFYIYVYISIIYILFMYIFYTYMFIYIQQTYLWICPLYSLLTQVKFKSLHLNMYYSLVITEYMLSQFYFLIYYKQYNSVGRQLTSHIADNSLLLSL